MVLEDDVMNQIEVEICMGSSCFTRGNKETVQQLKQFVADRNLDATIVVKGALCRGMCKEGPIVVINEMVYTNIDTGSIIDLVEDLLKR